MSTTFFGHPLVPMKNQAPHLGVLHARLPGGSYVRVEDWGEGASEARWHIFYWIWPGNGDEATIFEYGATLEKALRSLEHSMHEALHTLQAVTGETPA